MFLLSLDDIEVTTQNGMLLQSETGFFVCPGDIVLLSGKNGCGKSTLIRMIMGDSPVGGIHAQAHILYDNGKALTSSKSRQHFNQSVCYVPQDDVFEASRIIDCCLTSLETTLSLKNKDRYVFDFVMANQIYTVCYSDDETGRLHIKDHDAKRLLVKCGVDPAYATQQEIKSALFLVKNPERLSGGQKRIAKILSSIIRYEFGNLILMDEPLNSLDYDNVRLLSNILTHIHSEKPELGMLIVTHCRAISCINRILLIADKTICESKIPFVCSDCFGEIDNNGFYI